MDRGFCQAAIGYACLAGADDAGAEAAFLASRSEYASVDRPQAVLEADVGLAEVALRRGDVLSALELVTPLVDTTADLDLADCLRPAAMLLIARRVLDAAGDPRADALLLAGREYVLERARAIGDQDMAAGYLAKRSEAELLELAARSAAPGTDILAVDGGPG
jgi:hypothetical protein